MPATLDRPPVKPSPRDFVVIAEPQQKARRSVLDRYQQHLWLGGLSILIVGIALSPLVMGYLGRQGLEGRPAAAVSPSPLAQRLRWPPQRMT
jgi:hypothetical protein